MIGINKTKGEANHRCHRRQRDIALVEGQADADDLLSVPHALADHAAALPVGGIAAGARFGQSEAGNLLAPGETGQVVVFLFLGAVVDQKLARS